ncbi:MAG: two-component system histidine kinase PnpS [Candidatus Omnitrophota bacterium]
MFFRARFQKRIDELLAKIDQANIKIKELEKQTLTAHTILNSMIEGVVILDKDVKLISCNATAEKIFNIEQEKVFGKFFLEAIPNNDILELINDVLEKKQFISKELPLIWPLVKVFHINASPIFENDDINGCLLVIHDITELKKLENTRRDFVANVSHELRTPLTSIKGFIETLLEGAIDDKENAKQFLTIIKEQADRFDNLINDLLALAGLESKEIKLNPRPINLKQFSHRILLDFKARLEKKNIQVINELKEDLFVNADKERLEQVLINLIDNAIKFNKESGFIKITGKEIGNKIKIIIEDSGSGIPEKDIPRIFERFYRVDRARSRELGGTGLGLSIVKHIIDLHGGSVGVESTEGLGSKFYFYLPIS